jgi:hypothetical protein
MNVARAQAARIVKNGPGRLYRAFPAVVLGTMFNVLDAGNYECTHISPIIS